MDAIPAAEEIQGCYFGDLSLGMTAAYAKTLTETDIVLLAEFSGGVNTIHLNQEFSDATMFEALINHDMLTASSISLVLGTKLHGPSDI